MKFPKQFVFALALAFAMLYVQNLAATPAPQSTADSLMQNFHVRQCCAAPLARCLQEKPQCKIAPRLADFLRWTDSIGRVSDESMISALQDRYNTFADEKKYEVDLRDYPIIGDPNAPLTVVMYYSVTCPACKTNFRDLLPIIRNGSLKGKVKIVAKPFNDMFANRAGQAAHEFGRFTDFMLALAQVNERIDEHVIYDIADHLLFDRDKFRDKINSPEVTEITQRAGRETKKYDIQFVPTYIIGGRLYNSVTSPRWIIDAIEHIYEVDFPNHRVNR